MMFVKGSRPNLDPCSVDVDSGHSIHSESKFPTKTVAAAALAIGALLYGVLSDISPKFTEPSAPISAPKQP